MRYHLLIASIALFGCTSLTSLAQIGRSLEDCDRIFGRHEGPMKPSEASPGMENTVARVAYDYKWHGLYLRTFFTGRDVSDTRCVMLSMWKSGGDLTEGQVNDMLSINNNGGKWIDIPVGRFPGKLVRDDKHAFAHVPVRDLHAPQDLSIWTADLYRKNPPDYFKRMLEWLSTHPL